MRARHTPGLGPQEVPSNFGIVPCFPLIGGAWSGWLGGAKTGPVWSGDPASFRHSAKTPQKAHKCIKNRVIIQSHHLGDVGGRRPRARRLEQATMLRTLCLQAHGPRAYRQSVRSILRCSRCRGRALASVIFIASPRRRLVDDPDFEVKMARFQLRFTARDQLAYQGRMVGVT